MSLKPKLSEVEQFPEKRLEPKLLWVQVGSHDGVFKKFKEAVSFFVGTA